MQVLGLEPSRQELSHGVWCMPDTCPSSCPCARLYTWLSWFPRARLFDHFNGNLPKESATKCRRSCGAAACLTVPAVARAFVCLYTMHSSVRGVSRRSITALAPLYCVQVPALARMHRSIPSWVQACVHACVCRASNQACVRARARTCASHVQASERVYMHPFAPLCMRVWVHGCVGACIRLCARSCARANKILADVTCDG